MTETQKPPTPQATDDPSPPLPSSTEEQEGIRIRKVYWEQKSALANNKELPRKTELVEKLGKLIDEAEVAEKRIEKIHVGILLFLLITVFILALLMPLLIVKPFLYDYTHSFSLCLLLYMLFCTAMSFIVFMPLLVIINLSHDANVPSRVENLVTRVWPSILLVVSIGTVILEIVGKAYWPSTPLSHTLSASFLGAVFLYSGLIIIVKGSLRIRDALMEFVRFSIPSAIMIDGLSMAYLCASSDYRRDEALRLSLLEGLEKAAASANHITNTYNEHLDPDTRSWMNAEGAKIAADVRAAKRLCFRIPNESLVKWLDFCLIATLDGDWSSWPKLPNGTKSYIAKTSLLLGSERKTRITNTIKSLVVALLPASGFLIFRTLHPAYPIPAPVTAIVILWAVTRLMSTVDPSATSGIAALKDVTQSFNFSGKDTKEK